MPVATATAPEYARFSSSASQRAGSAQMITAYAKTVVAAVAAIPSDRVSASGRTRFTSTYAPGTAWGFCGGSCARRFVVSLHCVSVASPGLEASGWVLVLGSAIRT